MRIYKPTYTKPLPEGAKILRRKNGKYAKYRDKRGRLQEARLTKSGDKILVETAHWHIEFEDNNKIRRHLKAYTNERASNRLKDKIEELLSCQANNRQPDDELSKWLERIPAVVRDELIGFGLLDANRTAAGKKLIEHIEDYRNSLLAKERSLGHIKPTIASLIKTFTNCGFRYWSDISAEKLESYLARLRNGNGISYRTSNYYLKAVKGFCNWMIQIRRANNSPVQYLRTLDVALDRRHERRALTVNDLRRLLETTKSSPQERFGMCGHERYLLYRVAAESGLRANELRSLTVSLFELSTKPYTVTTKATHSKSRKEKSLPLRSDTAAELRDFLANKLPNAKAFGGTYKRLTDKVADMLKADLADAKILYVDNAGRVFDFHALRGETGTLLAASGVHPKLAQTIMRHSDINLTMNTYTHIFMGQEAEAVEALPDLSAPSKERIAKTGTDKN